MIARFDDMAWPYAALVWDRVLPMETLDQAAVLDFYARYGERTSRREAVAAPRRARRSPASAVRRPRAKARRSRCGGSRIDPGRTAR